MSSENENKPKIFHPSFFYWGLKHRKGVAEKANLREIEITKATSSSLGFLVSPFRCPWRSLSKPYFFDVAVIE